MDEDNLILVAALGVTGLIVANYLAQQAAAAGQTIPTYVKNVVQQAGTTPLDQYTPDSVLCQWFPSWCGGAPGTNTGTASGTTTGTADTGNVCYSGSFVGPLPPGAHYCSWGDLLHPLSTTVIGA